MDPTKNEQVSLDAANTPAVDQMRLIRGTIYTLKHDDNPFERIRAAESLVTLDLPLAMDALSRALVWDRDPRVREACATGLGRANTPAAVETLCEGLRMGASICVIPLSHSASPVAIDALCAGLELGRPKPIQFACAKALRTMDASVVAALDGASFERLETVEAEERDRTALEIATLADQQGVSPYNREWAASTLSDFANPDAIEALRRSLFSDDSGCVIDACARGLGQVGTVPAIAALCEGLHGQDPRTRTASVGGLLEAAGVPVAIAALRQGLDDQDAYVLRACARALKISCASALTSEEIEKIEMAEREEAEDIASIKIRLQKDNPSSPSQDMVREFIRINTPAAFEALREALMEYENVWERVGIGFGYSCQIYADCLGWLGSREAIKALRNGLDAEEQNLSYFCGYTLSKMGDSVAEQTWRRKVRENESRKEQAQNEAALINARSAEAKERLERYCAQDPIHASTIPVLWDIINLYLVNDKKPVTRLCPYPNVEGMEGKKVDVRFAAERLAQAGFLKKDGEGYVPTKLALSLL